MARLTFELKAEPRTISVESFIGIVRESLSILSDLDAVVSQRRRGTLRWTIGSLRDGSAVLEMESRVRHGTTDHSHTVARRFADGLRIAASEGVSPPLYSFDNLRSLLRMTQMSLKGGVDAIEVYNGTALPVRLDRQSQEKIQPLVGEHYRVIGSIEGRIELVSLHHPYRRFNIYHSRTNKAVRCTLPQAIEIDVIEAMREKRRVVVSGEVIYNFRSEPLAVDIQSPIKTLAEDVELPSLEETLGAIPDLTGNLSTEEHLRRLRSGIE